MNKPYHLACLLIVFAFGVYPVRAAAEGGSKKGEDCMTSSDCWGIRGSCPEQCVSGQCRASDQCKALHESTGWGCPHTPSESEAPRETPAASQVPAEIEDVDQDQGLDEDEEHLLDVVERDAPTPRP